MKIYSTIAFLIASMLFSANGAAKKVLNHTDFDRWEKTSNYGLSNNGEWAAFAVNPQEGDGMLYFHNTVKGTQIEVKRGYQPAFTADGKWAVALIKPFFGETRKAKILKKKDFDLPQDSLAIINLSTRHIEKIGDVISFKVPKDKGDFVAWKSCDTTLVKPASLKNKDAGRPMIVRNLTTGVSRTVNWVKDYAWADNGDFIAFNLRKEESDTLATNGTAVIKTADNSLYLIDRDKKFYGIPVFSSDSKMMAYVASDDSVKTGTKKSVLYLSNLTAPNFDSRNIAEGYDADLFVNQYSVPEFSHDGKRVVVGVAPVVLPDDTTLVSFENPSLDIWRWDAPYTPPQELSMVERLRKKTFPLVIDLATDGKVLVTSDPLCEVESPDRWDRDMALVSNMGNIMQVQWNYQFPVGLSLKNISDGSETLIGEVPNELYGLSPADRFVVWFEGREFHVYDISTGKTNVVGGDVPYPLWNEDSDIPAKEKEPYGVMGWTKNDGRLLVYDRYDIWSLDPLGVEKPVCITAGEGRRKNLKFRYVSTDPEHRFFKDREKILLSVFDYSTKQNGIASQTFSLGNTAPRIDFIGDYEVISLKKSKDADVCSWIQGNFSTSPNVYVSRNIESGKAEKVSNSNPWMNDYSWGTAQLFKWHTYNGKTSEGVLYLPEDFDPGKEYPMLVYFYEIYSDALFHHYDMEPSWSWINFPFYVSRGYVVFVPDIHYVPGLPGEAAYDYVCSGVDAVLKAYPNIDGKRVGIDGQSWGGYQTAYLVTRTNMFACAGSGAPVANMTSAFGGIRWGTGDSRQAQYEVGQSRIGRNLWEAPALYLANSPVFYADRVQTPLLIMHNDNDGAVPWYQGIEMFMALRRLGKPVWMLQYNGEAHNLKERRNRKDITRRLQQFFDHYLKGEPMPEWMKNGIPAIRKGQEFGY